MSALGRIGAALVWSGRMSETLRGLWLEVRVIPVLLWSFSALTLGTALAARGQELEVWYYLGAVALGVLIQGLLAHSVNEVEDWRSGTDKHASPRVISGGSKVIVAGLLSPRALWWVFAAAFTATTVIGLALVAAGGLDLLPFGLVGVAGAILYTLPPVRAAYRPFLGEGIAFICLVDCVLGAHLLQGPSIDLVTVAAAVAVAAYAVSMLMVHHYLDRDADAGADPPKVTSIVYLGLVRGRRYAIGWCLLALAGAIVGSAVQPRLLPLVVGYTAGLFAHLRCRPGDVASVTANETVIIFAGIASALAAAALLEPPLALTLLAAAALIALEMRMAVAPAHTPAA
jgi:1,4-dihydroxy-2-naphthoate polyprenyltransferase